MDEGKGWIVDGGITMEMCDEAILGINQTRVCFIGI